MSLSYRTINDEIPPFLRMRKERTYLLTNLLTMANIADVRLSIAFMSAYPLLHGKSPSPTPMASPLSYWHTEDCSQKITRMWANAQRDSRPAEYR